MNRRGLTRRRKSSKHKKKRDVLFLPRPVVCPKCGSPEDKPHKPGCLMSDWWSHTV